MTTSRPPQVWTRILEFVLPSEEGARVSDDLAEIWAARAKQDPRAANAWYRRQVIGFLMRFPVHRVLRTVRSVLRMGKRTRIGEESRPSLDRRSAPTSLLRWFDDFSQDVRLGLRTIRRSPLFSIACLLMLGLGIGGVTTIFSVVNAVLLEPLSFADPQRLVGVRESSPPEVPISEVAPGTFLDWKTRTTSFEGLSAYQTGSFTLIADERPERIAVARVTADLLAMLGVTPVLGRVFFDDEDQVGNDQVVVLSHRLWQQRFGSDPMVLGSELVLSGRSYSVVGVMPRGFEYPTREAELWMPLVFSQYSARSPNNRGGRFLGVTGRLKPGVGIDQARAELALLSQTLEEEFPEAKAGWGARVDPLLEVEVGDTRQALMVLLGAVALVLLIACVNVASMLLARATVRRREVAIRTALGAGRARLIRQLLTESLLLAGAGGVLGLLLAQWATQAIRTWAPEGLPRIEQAGFDLRVGLFAFVVMLFATLAFGLVPAVRAARLEQFGALREGGRGSTAGKQRHRTRHWLVVVEVVLAVVLLINASLLMRSFGELQRVDLGFNPHNVVGARIAFPPTADSDQKLPVYDQLIERIERLPGVTAVGTTNLLAPADAAPGRIDVFVDGQPIPEASDVPSASEYEVTPGYFDAMGIPLLQGRGFSNTDREDTPRVAILSQAMARRVFPDENPIGRRIVLRNSEPEVVREVVGVVGDIRDGGLRLDAPPQIYEPYAQVAHPSGGMVLVVRTSGTNTGLATALREELRAVDPNLPIYRIQGLEEDLGTVLARERLATFLMTIFAAISLFLVALGLYGIMSFVVAQRVHEMGIRMALGARAEDVRLLVLRQGLTWPLVGVGTGILVSAATTRVLGSLMYNVSATDPLTFVLIPVVLLATAALATYIPARRATRVDPVVVLKGD